MVPFKGPINDVTEVKPTILCIAIEVVEVVDVDLSVLDEAEKNYKVREDLKRDDWHYGYRERK